MNSVLTIGVASIMPGLGFWLLGQRQRAVIIGLVVLSLFVVFLIVPSRLTWLVFLGAWVSQIYYAIDTAQLSRKLAQGGLEVIGRPSGVTKKDRGQARIRKIIQAQLFPSDEHILVTLSCFYRDAFGDENTTIAIGVPILRICYLSRWTELFS